MEQIFYKYLDEIVLNQLMSNINNFYKINKNKRYTFIFDILYNSMSCMLSEIKKIDIMESINKEQLDFIIRLNQIRRIIYNNPEQLNIPFKLDFDDFNKLNKNEYFYGIINLFEKEKWLTVINNEFKLNVKSQEITDLVLILKQIYDSILRIERFLIDVCEFNDDRLIKILSIEQNNKKFVLWKKCLGIN